MFHILWFKYIYIFFSLTYRRLFWCISLSNMFSINLNIFHCSPSMVLEQIGCRDRVAREPRMRTRPVRLAPLASVRRSGTQLKQSLAVVRESRTCREGDRQCRCCRARSRFDEDASVFRRPRRVVALSRRTPERPRYFARWRRLAPPSRLTAGEKRWWRWSHLVSPRLEPDALLLAGPWHRWRWPWGFDPSTRGACVSCNWWPEEFRLASCVRQTRESSLHHALALLRLRR